MKIAELASLPAGMPVVDLAATVIAAYEPKRGTSAHGEWVKLPLIVKDDAGDTIAVDWFSPTTEAHATLKGQAVTISARKNQKGQMAGTKVSEYQGKDGLKRSVTVSGDHLTLGASTPAHPVSEPQKPAQAAQQASPGGYHSAHTYSDTEIMAAIPEWIRWIRFGIAELFPGNLAFEADQQAVMATVNTLIIAATNGKLKIDMASSEKGDK